MCADSRFEILRRIVDENAGNIAVEKHDSEITRLSGTESITAASFTPFSLKVSRRILRWTLPLSITLSYCLYISSLRPRIYISSPAPSSLLARCRSPHPHFTCNARKNSRFTAWPSTLVTRGRPYIIQIQLEFIVRSS